MDFFEAIKSEFQQVTMPWAVLFGTALGLDVALGIAAAWAKERASSSVSRIGIVRKLAMISIVLGFAVADGVFPQVVVAIPLIGSLSLTLAGVAAFFLTITEAHSILEKWVMLGLPLPKNIKKRLIQVRDSFDLPGKDGE